MSHLYLAMHIALVPLSMINITVHVLHSTNTIYDRER